MTRLHRWWLPTLLTSALALAACGGDDDDEKPAGDGGLDGGKDGGIDASTDGGREGGTAVQCGTATCSAYPPFGPVTATPCCFTATNTCSGIVSLFGPACVPPAVNNATCPSVTLAGQLAPGCCALSGKCGINGNPLGVGCVDLSNDFIRGSVMAALDGGTLPPITSCGDAGN